MSQTQVTTSNALAVKLFERKTWTQNIQRTCFGRLFQRGAIYTPEGLMNNESARGDQITFPYVGKLTGLPFGEGQVAYGNEEALELRAHAMSINSTRVAVSVPASDSMDQFRTHIDLEQKARSQAADRLLELLEISTFYQLAGANPTSLTVGGTTFATTAQKLHVQGHNTPTAPTSERIVRASSAATDQALTASDKFSLDLIDYALELSDRSVQPIKMLDGDTFDLYISPEQYTDLKHNSSSKIQWFNIALAQLTSGNASAITQGVDGLVGRYGPVNIYVSPRIAYGVNGSSSAVITTVRRAVLVGRDALSYASPFGGRPTDKKVPLIFKEQQSDIGEQKSIAGKIVYGLKKMAPSNKQDTGVIVLSTYAGSH